jgi:hypothetical protein
MTAGLPAKPRTRGRASFLALTIVGAAVGLAACGGEEETAANDDQNQSPSSPPPSGGGNQAPTISGNPPASVMQGTQYSFTPTASDANGDVLTFSVTNLPSWAAFSATNGALSGTPDPGDVGTYSNIQISVSDGAATTSLAAFSVQVMNTGATGTATLSWVPPTQNTDGSPLTVAGYRIYWGTTLGNYSNSVTLSNPGLTTYMIDQLTPATWYFVATAFNAQGAESPFSNVAEKTIQ